MKILIKKSAITQTLQSYIDTQSNLTYITTDGSNDQAVLAELQSIGDDFSMYSSTVTGESGVQADGILLPKEAL